MKSEDKYKLLRDKNDIPIQLGYYIDPELNIHHIDEKIYGYLLENSKFTFNHWNIQSCILITKNNANKLLKLK